jgi:hypothetical protein
MLQKSLRPCSRSFLQGNNAEVRSKQIERGSAGRKAAPRTCGSAKSQSEKSAPSEQPPSHQASGLLKAAAPLIAAGFVAVTGPEVGGCGRRPSGHLLLRAVVRRCLSHPCFSCTSLPKLRST